VPQPVGELLRLGHDGIANVAADISKTLNLVSHFVGRLLLEPVLFQILQLFLKLTVVKLFFSFVSLTVGKSLIFI
jgi:hypothetical protein